MMYEDWGRLPAEVGRLTLPQLTILLGKQKPKTRKLTPAQAKAMGLIR